MGRWLVSVGLALAVVLADRFVPAPGVDTELLAAFGSPVTLFGNAAAWLLLGHVILAFANEKATRIVGSCTSSRSRCRPRSKHPCSAR